MRHFYVYILANTRGRRPVLYVGITRDIHKRIAEHKTRPTGFVRRYRVDTLVLVEQFFEPRDAIAREKQIKGWTRAKKLALIKAENPGLVDLVGTAASRNPWTCRGGPGGPSLRSG